MKPRCGRPMLRFEAVWGALLEDPVCGRPEGHNPPCRSEQAILARRQRDLAPAVAQRKNELRNARRHRERQAVADGAARSADVLAEALREDARERRASRAA